MPKFIHSMLRMLVKALLKAVILLAGIGLAIWWATKS